ncbi:WD40 repeat-like protein [Piedraia hortae CBS 480.64]|uniref:WD40 repeat-like protein n=1 Tax=Piedraia hortae CBS 480.64 TaxID=1314780 RepID=A0A6A7BX65_9PEZI|nr:WD40 repeat-like protein [Piedraia hortae CBS 480.64]
MAMHPTRQAYVAKEEEEEDVGVDISSIPVDYNYKIQSAASGLQSKQASAVLNEFARKRKAAALAVPTDDKRVRTELQARGEPQTLFGERPEDRRNRLREILYLEQEEGGDGGVAGEVRADEGEEEEGEFYTEGSQALLQARREMARYSLPKAKKRIALQRLESRIPVQTHVEHRARIKEKLSGFELYGSQIVSERPLSIVRFAPNGNVAAVGDWGGNIKLLDVPNMEETMLLRGHRQHIGGLSWYPGATLPESGVTADNVNLASSGADCAVYLWSRTQDTPVASLSGHSARVCRTEFHPSGRYLASASYDTTWRLWDVETTTELLFQEGHSKEVYTVSFNGDGSLIASAGLDSIGRVWDLRTGRTVMLLEGHIAPIHGLDWGTDSTRVLTGSNDGLVKCWDLRTVRETTNIGAHQNGVCDVRWFKDSQPGSAKDIIMTDSNDANNDSIPEPKVAGTFLVTAGFDKKVNIWSADDWALCKCLIGHDGAVLATDVTSDAKWIASCGRDRTLKLWSRADGEGLG